jgi:hypothetical protein
MRSEVQYFSIMKLETINSLLVFGRLNVLIETIEEHVKLFDPPELILATKVHLAD